MSSHVLTPFRAMLLIVKKPIVRHLLRGYPMRYIGRYVGTQNGSIWEDKLGRTWRAAGPWDPFRRPFEMPWKRGR